MCEFKCNVMHLKDMLLILFMHFQLLKMFVVYIKVANNVKLKDVFFVLDIEPKLVSVKKATEKGSIVFLERNTC